MPRVPFRGYGKLWPADDDKEDAARATSQAVADFGLVRRACAAPFIQAQKAEFPVEMMCQHFGVSRRGYYAFCRRGPSQRAAQDRELAVQIRAIHPRSRGTYGRPRVQAALRSEGVRTRSKRVGRLMKQEGLQARRPRRMRSTADSGHKLPVAETVLARAFFAQALNEAWVGDITFIPMARGWLYLAVLLASGDSFVGQAQALPDRGCSGFLQKP